MARISSYAAAVDATPHGAPLRRFIDYAAACFDVIYYVPRHFYSATPHTFVMPFCHFAACLRRWFDTTILLLAFITSLLHIDMPPRDAVISSFRAAAAMPLLPLPYADINIDMPLYALVRDDKR